MISLDRDALICDLAETYGLYDLRALPVSTLATLAVGLREDSRIKMCISGVKVSRMEMLLAAAVDRLSLLVWAKTENGRNNVNRPKSILDIILDEEEQKSDVRSFASAEDFENEWARITGVKHG